MTCQAHPALVKLVKCTIPGPVSCRCQEPRWFVEDPTPMARDNIFEIHEILIDPIFIVLGQGKITKINSKCYFLCPVKVNMVNVLSNSTGLYMTQHCHVYIHVFVCIDYTCTWCTLIFFLTMSANCIMDIHYFLSVSHGVYSRVDKKPPPLWKCHAFHLYSI